MDKQLEREFNKAKAELFGNNKFIFISTIFCGLKHIFADEVPIPGTGSAMKNPTAMTDGKSVWYNADFWLEQSPKVRISVLLHEVWHVVLDHMNRVPNNVDVRTWQIACDHAVNNLLKKAGCEVPATWYCDKKYQDWGTELIYIDLLKENQNDPDQSPVGGMGADLIQQPNLSDVEKQKARHKLDNLIQRAFMQAEREKQTGNIPGSLMEYINKLRNPVIPWHDVLRRFMNDTIQDEYSWAKPNRRYVHSGLYLPSNQSEGIKHVVVAADLSGSISTAEIEHFASNLISLMKTISPEVMTLLQFDTQIHAEFQLTNASQIMDIPFKGRDGTNVTCIMEWAIKHKPDVLIVLSDGYFNVPPVKPKCPIVWLIHNYSMFKMPFGRTIHYTLES